LPHFADLPPPVARHFDLWTCVHVATISSRVGEILKSGYRTSKVLICVAGTANRIKAQNNFILIRSYIRSNYGRWWWSALAPLRSDAPLASTHRSVCRLVDTQFCFAGEWRLTSGTTSSPRDRVPIKVASASLLDFFARERRHGPNLHPHQHLQGLRGHWCPQLRRGTEWGVAPSESPPTVTKWRPDSVLRSSMCSQSSSPRTRDRLSAPVEKGVKKC
jgi:hypothetical protein